MDRRSYNYNYESVHRDDAAKFYSRVIIIINIITVILGACIIAMGIYINLDGDFRSWVQDLGMQIYWTGTYILLAAGVLVIAISIFGLCGGFLKIRSLLYAMIALMAIAVILEIAGSAYMLDHGLRGSKIETWIRKKFYELIDDRNSDRSSQRILDIIQERVGCCGVDGALDYVKWNKVIPSTCYDPIKGNAWYKEDYGYVGCARGFTTVLSTKAGWIAGLSLATAFFQLICMLFAFFLIRIKSDYKEDN